MAGFKQTTPCYQLKVWLPDFWNCMALVLSGDHSLVASPGPSGVTPGDLWALVGAILLATFSLGIAIGWIRLRAVRGPAPAILQSGKWERLVGKACALSTVGTPYPWPSGITSIIHWAHHPGLRRGRVSTPARIPWPDRRGGSQHLGPGDRGRPLRASSTFSWWRSWGSQRSWGDILFIPRPVWDTTVANLKLTETAADGTTLERDLSPVEQSRITDSCGGSTSLYTTYREPRAGLSDKEAQAQQRDWPHIGLPDHAAGADHGGRHVLPIQSKIRGPAFGRHRTNFGSAEWYFPAAEERSTAVRRHEHRRRSLRVRSLRLRRSVFPSRQMESGRKRKHPAQPTYNSGRSRSKPTRCHCCCWKPQMLKDTKDNMEYIKTSMASSGRRHAWGIIYTERK